MSNRRQSLSDKPQLFVFAGLILVILLSWWAFSPTDQSVVAAEIEVVEQNEPPLLTALSGEDIDLKSIDPESTAPESTAPESTPVVVATKPQLVDDPSAVMVAEVPHEPLYESQYEQQLLVIIEQMEQAEFTSALQYLDAHLARYPNSRVGSLLMADALTALNQNSLVKKTIPTIPQEFDVEGLRRQIEARWLHKNPKVVHASHTLLPSALLDLGDSKYVLVADLQTARLYVYRNDEGQPTLVSDYYLTVGSQGFGKRVEGDNKTPVGIYHVNRFIGSASLPDLYGSGAFPINYPNTLDKAKKRTGYGIWLHGTPSNTYARQPWASEGCFVLSNEDFEHIQQYISVDEQTPVVLADHIEWVTTQQLTDIRAEHLGVIEAWRQSWESLNTQAYLDFYAREQFNFGRGGYADWAKQKALVNQAKTFVQVQIELLGVFQYPGEKDMFVAEFTQKYLSNNHAGVSNKLQYWQRDMDGHWKIVYEN